MPTPNQSLPKDKTTKIEFTRDEFSALSQLIDAGVRSAGLQAVKLAALVLPKLEKAGDVFVEDVPVQA